jgi:hypothetical protein
MSSQQYITQSPKVLHRISFTTLSARSTRAERGQVTMEVCEGLEVTALQA